MQSATLHRCLFACLALACLGLGSCATPLSKNECMAMDWRTIGYEDGAAGYPASRIGVHRRACGEHGVAPDFDAYQAGRAEGLLEFCTAANGYRIGAAGREYAGVCPVEREGDFLRAFSEGHESYVMRSRVNATSSQLAAKRRELERLEKAVVHNAAAAVDETATREARAAAVLETAKLAEQVGKVKTEIRQLEQDLAHQRQELDAYLAIHPPLVGSRQE
jgi:hypothetical protein